MECTELEELLDKFEAATSLAELEALEKAGIARKAFRWK
jgi:hypothetical protein